MSTQNSRLQRFVALSAVLTGVVWSVVELVGHGSTGDTHAVEESEFSLDPGASGTLASIVSRNRRNSWLRCRR